MKNGVKLIVVLTVVAMSVPSYAADPATVSLYKMKCAGCHAMDGSAGTPMGKKLGAHSFLSPEVMKLSDAELAQFTAKGKGKMPPFGKALKDGQINGLVGYIRELMKARK